MLFWIGYHYVRKCSQLSWCTMACDVACSTETHGLSWLYADMRKCSLLPWCMKTCRVAWRNALHGVSWPPFSIRIAIICCSLCGHVMLHALLHCIVCSDLIPQGKCSQLPWLEMARDVACSIALHGVPHVTNTYEHVMLHSALHCMPCPDPMSINGKSSQLPRSIVHGQ